MKKGIVFGCFDPLHAGHIRLLRECRHKCTYLHVLIHSDDYIRTQKGREPFFNEIDRLEDVGDIIWADSIEINEGTDRNKWIEKLGISVIFVAGDMDGRGFICESIRVPRTEGINSTMLRS